MRSLEIVGQLRRYGIWDIGKKARGTISPHVCAAIHRTVVSLGPSLTPTNLQLKHRYDFCPVYLDPTGVDLVIRAGGWRRRAGKSPWMRIRAWYEEGDGLKSVHTHPTRNFHGRFVLDGDWDLRAKPLGILPVIIQLFQEGRRPEETDAYQRHLQDLQAGRLTWTKGIRSVEELDAYYSELVRVYDNIRANGYRTQRDLGESGSDEVRIAINRLGEPCVFGGGTHRLSIAKLLQLDRIPVMIKRVHSNWVDSLIEQAGEDDPVQAIQHGLAVLGQSAGPGIPIDHQITDAPGEGTNSPPC